MLDDQTGTGGIVGQPAGYDYKAGASVCDAVGNKIGSLSDLGVQNGCLVVRHGMLPPRDAWVPLEQITRLEPDGIFLNLGKDDLNSLDREGERAASTATLDATGGMSHTTQRPPVHLQLLQGHGANGGMGSTERAETVDQNEVRVPLREEELVAGTREEEIGRVHVGKDVVEEQQTVSAPVSHEEVYVERVPTEGRPVEPGDDAFQERDIDVPVMGEELVTGKRAQVTDEVRIGKREVTEQQQATDTVRKERLHVDQTDGQGNITKTDGRPLSDATGEGTVEPTP